MSMNRRNFMAGIAPLAMAPAALAANGDDSDADDRQYLEWIRYTLPGRRDKRVEKYYEEAAIPALNRLGIHDVGVFSVMYGPNDPSLYVLIPHDSIDSLMTGQKKLLEDEFYQAAAKEYLESSISDPAFARVERGLMRAFSGIGLTLLTRRWELRLPISLEPGIAIVPHKPVARRQAHDAAKHGVW